MYFLLIIGLTRKDNFELWKFKEVKLTKDKLKVKTKSKTLEFSGIEHIDTFTRMLPPFFFSYSQNYYLHSFKKQQRIQIRARSKGRSNNKWCLLPLKRE